MKKLQKQSELAHRQKFELIFLCMNPGYDRETVNKIKSNAELLDIEIRFFKSNIFSVVTKTGGSPCYLCAKMRRGNLYAQAKKLGCNKIALAHHFDDTAETIMLNLLYNGRVQTMMPKLKSQNFENMQLIRPLCLVREKDIIRWRDQNSLEFINCACPLTKDRCFASGKIGKRMEVKMLLSEIEDGHPAAPKNIYNAMNNINLNAVLGYKINGIHKSFLDN
jgi:tRNA(Ile)-lysidine synthase TilS/MesJ